MTTRGLSTVLAYACMASTCFGQEKVLAKKWFGAGSPKEMKYIETDATQILVFDAAFGDYVLDGATLDVDAPVVEVIGKVTIRSFAAGAKAADAVGQGGQGSHGLGGGQCGRDGCNGGNGGEGGKGPGGEGGRSGPYIKIKIKKIVGTGTLTVINQGVNGGDGGRGGNGGNGGPGARGQDRSCADWTGAHGAGPGNGGQGGDGGSGGLGGDAGQGGRGGDVHYSKDLVTYLNTKISLTSVGGSSGSPGPGGLGGAPGPGNAGGSGKDCVFGRWRRWLWAGSGS